MRCIICSVVFRTPHPEMRKDQICSLCKSNQNIDPDYYKIKLNKQKKKHEEMLYEMEIKSFTKESRLKKQREPISHNSKKIKDSNDDEIFNECELLIKNYKKRSNISKHNVDLMEYMIETYLEIGSLRKLCEVINKDISTIKNDFRNLVRVPIKLKELVNENKLTSDPILATEIAIYATDHFDWDQEETKIEEVITFAKNMAIIFKNNLKLRREFFATKDDYTKPLSASTKKNYEHQAILEEWPVKESKYEFNRFTDRTGKQYKFIVIYSKDLDSVRFLRRWEYEKGRRISKIWATEIISQIKEIGNAKEFVKEHSDEFND